jgi:ketosteroid isomerase-like protein
MDEQSERVATEVAVLEANHDFYRAFSEGDFDAMSRVWAVRAPVVCMHPGLPPVVGRSAVLDSWKQILPPAAEWEMSCRAARAHVMGASAFVTCLEASGDKPAHLAATNVFVLEDGHWRLVHHQAGPLSNPVSASARDASN